MSDSSILGLIVTVLWLVVKAIAWARRMSSQAEPEPAPTSAPELAPESARGSVGGSVGDSSGVEGARLDGRWRDALAARGAEAVAAARTVLARTLALPPSSTIVREVLENRVIPELVAAVGSIQAAHDVRELDRLKAIIGRGLVRVRVLETIALWRSDPKLGAHLADADTLAEVLIEPLALLARTENIPFATHRPICVPADPNGEAVVIGLLPRGYPVIFVPRDFSKNLFRWASIAHEIGHVVWRSLPGFAREVEARTGLFGPATLIRADRLESADQVWISPFRAWLEEIACDAFAIMMLGPSGLRSLIESFASPDDVDAILWARGRPDGTYEEHPPAHLRVVLGALLLEEMGYDVEAKALRREWEDRHGGPRHLFLEAWPDDIAVPVEVFATAGAEVVRRFYRDPYASLAGRQLRSVHGLELSPASWAKAQASASDLLAGHPLRHDARTIIAGAIEARNRSPENGERIARAVMRSILGRDVDERRPADRAYAGASSGRSASRSSSRSSSSPSGDDLVEAVILGTLLARDRSRPLSRCAPRRMD